jgi:hypothetical protein
MVWMKDAPILSHIDKGRADRVFGSDSGIDGVITSLSEKNTSKNANTGGNPS